MQIFKKVEVHCRVIEIVNCNLLYNFNTCKQSDLHKNLVHILYFLSAYILRKATQNKK